jgi:hypothetical protein
MRRIILASLMALATGGCGLISSDVTETPFDLPAKMFSFDSAAFGVPAGISQEVPCGAGQIVTDCCAVPGGPDCATTPITCQQNESGVSVCMATVTVTQSQMTNLGMEAPKLAGLTGYVEIKVKRISYAVTANTLNVDLPDVGLYMAPQGVMSASDPAARRFGTMPGIPAMTPTSGDVMLETDAGATFKMFTQDITVPFTFIATTTVTVSRAPTGRIDLTVTGKLAASL